jgi:beta-glucanase (GH16 family)
MFVAIQGFVVPYDMRFVQDCNKVASGPCFSVLPVLLVLISLGFSSALSGQPTFADEFKGVKGAAFDNSKWTAETGGSGWGNEELQYYTGDTENVRLDGDGNLEIRAIPLDASATVKCWYGKCRYTSARLITKGKFQFKYGRVEARIKVPEGAGVWPAFWMLGDDIDKVGWPNRGEIDIMEFIGREPATVYGTIHGPGYSGASGISRSTTVAVQSGVPGDFHIFAVEWTDNEIKWFLDEKQYASVTRKDLPSGAKWVFDHPHFIILNFAVGGKWPGSPSAATKFPQSMLIDYVRVSPLLSERSKS